MAQTTSKSFATFPSGARFLYVTRVDIAIEYFMIEQNILLDVSVCASRSSYKEHFKRQLYLSLLLTLCNVLFEF